MGNSRVTQDDDAVKKATKLAEKLRGAGDRCTNAAEKALAMGGEKVATKAKQNIVTNGSVRTGYLLNSLTTQFHKSAAGPYVLVGTNTEYAPYVEYGTAKMPAKPFLRPAVSESLEDIKQELKDALKQALREML